VNLPLGSSGGGKSQGGGSNLSMECRICGSAEGNREYIVREMMFGLRDEFVYVECADCGCLQIAEIPLDLGRYYPPEYYSFGDPPALVDPFPRNWLKRKRAVYCLTGKGVAGRVAARLFGVPRHYDWFKRTNVHFGSAILDVGCGAGHLLVGLYKEGFENLTGVDPFIDRDISYAGGITIHKRELGDVAGEYDLVMLNHSFEHMQDPVRTMAELGRLCKNGGRVLIRIPVAGCHAWERYRGNWVQIDAPRHLFLHTRKSMELLAAASGLEITDVVCDSTEFQFWGSEQYMKDIPLRDDRSYSVNPSRSIFSKSEMDEFRRRAAKLNEEGRGDSACFYIRKPGA